MWQLPLGSIWKLTTGLQRLCSCRRDLVISSITSLRRGATLTSIFPSFGKSYEMAMTHFPSKKGREDTCAERFSLHWQRGEAGHHFTLLPSRRLG